jgi:hypothetical protein
MSTYEDYRFPPRPFPAHIYMSEAHGRGAGEGRHEPGKHKAGKFKIPRADSTPPPAAGKVYGRKKGLISRLFGKGKK